MLFRELGISTAPFREIRSRADLDRALEELGLPAILKTRRFGYDGKGQIVLRSETQLDAAWEELGGRDLILEGFVQFEREVSVLGVRGRDGTTRFWPATENLHVDGILRVSRAPARELSGELFASAQAQLEAIMTRLDYVGVLVVEFFQVGSEFIANEMACRVHNSGHWTIEAAETSQFENHLRAVTGMPLGSTRTHGQAAMINLIGEIPDLSGVEDNPGTHVHVYGKSAAAGRKLGHITLQADAAAALEVKLESLLQMLGEADRRAS
jgi:5-(carboxyamino)imidazole ribonucleotide synthase